MKGLSNYKYMTPVQSMSLPYSLKGFDIICEAPTGSGKTLCFIIPILDQSYLKQWIKLDGLFALIITPTRELAFQIFSSFKQFTCFEISLMLAFGGKRSKYENTVLSSIGILVGTPGRVLYHLENCVNLCTDNLAFLVCDEADKMIEYSFIDNIKNIVNVLPDKSRRQNLFFSATMRGSVSALTKIFCREGATKSISVAALKDSNDTNELGSKIKHYYCVVGLQDKINLLYSLLTKYSTNKIIVFFTTIKQVRFVFEAFSKLKIGSRLYHIHGNQSQTTRIEIFEDFKNKPNTTVLFTTDLIGRGIDFPAVDNVIHYDCPENVKTYIHRSGRTGRGCDATGISYLFLLESEMRFVDYIKEYQINIQKYYPKLKQLSGVASKLRALQAHNNETS
uniref:ATP-dependent RNA helicase n=1 Tax=Dermatophagoides pteronyssinus TaxID=6956 RepID=A0A6P6XK24_DERPT|nr:ATP-dependent RNA helicase DBP4-like [Dermatophagoides pteronyssinus]